MYPSLESIWKLYIVIPAMKFDSVVTSPAAAWGSDALFRRTVVIGTEQILRAFLLFSVLCLGSVGAAAQQSGGTTPKSTSDSTASSIPTAPQSQRKEHTFSGTVKKVDANTGKLTVDGESVPGWMAKMTMAYRVSATKTPMPKAGDHITAKVYDGDFQTLYDVRVAPVASIGMSEQPPLAYVCDTPGDEAVVEDTPGSCPKSGVPRIPVRLVTVYSCLRFQTFIQEQTGVCPVDKSELVPVTAALYFVCKDDSKVHELDPGTCADGSARIKSFDRRPHGDHNPRHGGQFFMADDNWHHLEGTLIRPNIFRVYFYNDFTQPLVATGFSATVAKTDATGKEIAVPIATKAGQSKDRNTREVIVSGTKLPASFELRVKFKPDDKERVYNFTFADYSKEPIMPSPSASTTVVSTAVAGTKPQASASVTPPSESTAPKEPASPSTLGEIGASGKSAEQAAPQQSAADAAFTAAYTQFYNPSSYDRSAPIPNTIAGIVEALGQRNDEVRSLIDRGSFTDLWVPAFQAKDLGLAISDHAAELPAYKRKLLDPAVVRLVRAVWLLDAFGDLGNREQINEAYSDFAAAVSEVKALFNEGQ
jgi:Cu/Ag efflux protein CusF